MDTDLKTQLGNIETDSHAQVDTEVTNTGTVLNAQMNNEMNALQTDLSNQMEGQLVNYEIDLNYQYPDDPITVASELAIKRQELTAANQVIIDAAYKSKMDAIQVKLNDTSKNKILDMGPALNGNLTGSVANIENTLKNSSKGMATVIESKLGKAEVVLGNKKGAPIVTRATRNNTANVNISTPLSSLTTTLSTTISTAIQTKQTGSLKAKLETILKTQSLAKITELKTNSVKKLQTKIENKINGKMKTKITGMMGGTIKWPN